MSNGKEWFIYTLKDPRDNEVRYVGFTHNTKKRMSDHTYVGRKKRTHKVNWINSLIAIGMQPILEVIEQGTGESWQPVEKYWIAYYRSIGASLTNSTDGGEGLINPSQETRELIARAQTGRVKTPEEIEKQASKLRGTIHTQERKDKTRISRINSGYVMTDETRRKKSEVMKGKTHSEEARRKMSNSRRGKKRSLESIEKTRQKHIGSKRSDESKERIRLSKKSFKIVRVQDGFVFNSIREASRATGIDFRAIQTALKCGHATKGYNWRPLIPDENHPNVSIKKASKIPVRRIDDGKSYTSISEAARDVGVLPASIGCAIKRNGSSAGYKWELVSENE